VTRSSPPRVSGWRLLAALVLWAVLVGVIVAATVLVARLLVPGWAARHRADLSAILLAGAYVALLAALLLAFGGPAGLRDRLGLRFTSALDLVGALGTWFAAAFVGGVATKALAPVLGQPQSNAESLLRQSFDPLFVALVVPTVCLLGPLGEELLFRGALYGWLRGWLPAPAVIPLTAAAFAAAHLLPPLLPVFFAFGLGAGWVRERSGSTLNSLAMHVTQNTVAVALTYLLLVST
jgi:membrane protease YdiL (CAAX protease family)